MILNGILSLCVSDIRTIGNILPLLLTTNYDIVFIIKRIQLRIQRVFLISELLLLPFNLLHCHPFNQHNHRKPFDTFYFFFSEMRIVCCGGANVNPSTPFNSSSTSSAAPSMFIVKWRKRLPVNTKSSILARSSPKHIRFPV